MVDCQSTLRTAPAYVFAWQFDKLVPISIVATLFVKLDEFFVRFSKISARRR